MKIATFLAAFASLFWLDRADPVSDLVSEAEAHDRHEFHVFKKEVQDKIDDREFSERGIQRCHNCPTHPTVPKFPCEYGYRPLIVHEGKPCACVKEYECCPRVCPKLNKKELAKCHWVNGIKKFGVYYGYITRDCCQCQIVVCHECPKEDEFKCENECDYPISRPDPYTKCLKKVCVKKPKPTATPSPDQFEACKKQYRHCHHSVQVTDNCGYHSTECRCNNITDCRPELSENTECQYVTKEWQPAWRCRENSHKCERCYQYKYKPIKYDNVVVKCRPCEIKRIETGKCGNYTESCQCHTPEGCWPRQQKPRHPECYDISIVKSKDTFGCTPSGTCKPCYYYNYVLKPVKPPIQVKCPRPCWIQVPKQEKCGIKYTCKCVGRNPKECLFPKIVHQGGKCFYPVRVIDPTSFMCTRKPRRGCRPCRKVVWRKKKCPYYKDVKCKKMCEKRERIHIGCNCHKFICLPIYHPNCVPEKPSKNICYTKPKRIYIKNQYSFDQISKTCKNCYYFVRKHKKFDDVDTCKFNDLPKECYSKWSKKGKCNQIIIKCRKNAEICTERYKECPKGMQVVTLNTKCGNPRDACMNCDQEFKSKEINKNLPDHCFEDRTINFLGNCKYNIPLKKACPTDNLALTKCQQEGQKRELFFDDCNCPMLKCTGCPVNAKLDLQIILDSSNSIGLNSWQMVREFLKLLIETINTGDTLICIGRYGGSGTFKHLTPCSKSVKGSDLDDSIYDYEPLGNTHTAEAMDYFRISFENSARINQSDVFKAVLILTDGQANGGGDVTQASQKWVDLGAKVYVSGFAQAVRSGLIKISKHYWFKPNLEDLIDALRKEFVPIICGKENSMY